MKKHYTIGKFNGIWKEKYIDLKDYTIGQNQCTISF